MRCRPGNDTVIRERQLLSRPVGGLPDELSFSATLSEYLRDPGCQRCLNRNSVRFGPAFGFCRSRRKHPGASFRTISPADLLHWWRKPHGYVPVYCEVNPGRDGVVRLPVSRWVQPCQGRPRLTTLSPNELVHRPSSAAAKPHPVRISHCY